MSREMLRIEDFEALLLNAQAELYVRILESHTPRTAIDVYSKFIRGLDNANRDVSLYLSSYIVSLWEAVFSLSMDFIFIGKIF
jgi:hypothetical protein